MMVKSGYSKLGVYIGNPTKGVESKTSGHSYVTLQRPHLEYGNASWCPIYRKDSELLENTQRRATKLAPSIKDLSYTDRLIALGLPSLYYRRARGDVIEMYKHTHGKYTVVADYIKMDTDPRSRGHKYKLKKQRATKTIRQQFSNRVNTWNCCHDVVDAPSSIHLRRESTNTGVNQI